jgi:hypothetical protein
MNCKQRIAAWLFPELFLERKHLLAKLLEQKKEIRYCHARVKSAEDAIRALPYVIGDTFKEHDRQHHTMLRSKFYW